MSRILQGNSVMVFPILSPEVRKGHAFLSPLKALAPAGSICKEGKKHDQTPTPSSLSPPESTGCSRFNRNQAESELVEVQGTHGCRQNHLDAEGQVLWFTLNLNYNLPSQKLIRDS